MLRPRCLFVMLPVLLAAGARAADKDVEDLLSHMRAAYQAVKSATFTTESHFGEATFINTFSYQGPSKIRLDITAPDKKDFKSSLVKVSDGKSISMKLPNATDYTHQDFSLDAYEANLPANLESFCFFDSERQLSTAAGKNMEKSVLKISTGQEWKGKKWTVLEETATAQNVQCRYFIDPKTFFIWRTVVRPLDADKDLGDSQITAMNTSAKIDEGVFKTPG